MTFGAQSEAANVKVQVYTPTYRKVQDIVFPQVQPGTPITLDLLDKWGARLSNGIYYLVVTTSQGKYTLKLLVLR